MMENIKPGDLVVVTWNDGYEVKCKYVTTKSGFHIFEDDKGKSVVCRMENAKISKS